MQLVQDIRDLIYSALEPGVIDRDAIVVERPADRSHGDFSTPVAFVLAKAVGMPPFQLSYKIEEKIKSMDLPDWVQNIAATVPGFINITLKPEYLCDLVQSIPMLGSEYGRNTSRSGQLVLVEHSSPNLFKPFHIGHMMNNAIGESIFRLARASGARAIPISYPSDISLGIAKAIRVVMNDGAEVLDSLATPAQQVEYLGQCYVRGNNEFADNPAVVAECKDIAKKLYDATPSPELTLYQRCKEINMNDFKNIAIRLGSWFEAFIYESESGAVGEAIVRSHPELFTESEGAIVYQGEQDGLHTRVFINSEGYPTYEAKDLGLLSLKFERYNPDLSVFVTDHEQTNYFQVVSAAAGKINPAWQERTVHRTHGRMTLRGQKMSSRLGGVPVAAETLQMIIDVIRGRTPDITDKDAEVLAIAAIKFMILRSKAGSNINFDPDTSLSLEGDTGPYLQYTVVRARSVLAKIPDGYIARNDVADDITDMDIERVLLHFPAVVGLAIDEWAPHYITTYLLELAQTFNSWYGRNRIIDAENPHESYNITLTRAVAITVENGLELLGIRVPERM